MLKLFYVGLGGFFGAISRYSISKWIETRWESALPWGTLTVNLLGSLILGFLMTIFMEKIIAQPYLRITLTTGFLGALTTFSTFSYETVILLEEKDFFLAGINIFSNLILGLVFVMIGIFIARAL